jgi:putative nucleotidyltransferase with HDIG domain
MHAAPTSRRFVRQTSLAAILDRCGDARAVRLAGELGSVLPHGTRVAALSLAMAAQAGLATRRRPLLARAALLHDVGKRYIPAGVLDKPSDLLPHERQLVEAHSTVGASMLLEAGLVEEAAIVRHHHERWDGSGYPDRLFGLAIPYESRIILVADAFDAMTSDRAYRDALPVQVAVAEIDRCAGSQLDPACAQLLHEVL